MPTLPFSVPWLTRNLGTKLIALSLALVVYVHVYTEQEDERRISVPLVVSGLGPNLVLLSPAPEEVTITARGKRKQLFKMDWNRPHLDMDLTGARPGEVQRMLSPADVAMDPGVEASIKSVDTPRLVTVEVDTVIQKTVRVSVPLLGDLPDNLAWAHAVRPEPTQVTMTGPSRELEKVEEVMTVPLDLATLQDPGDTRFPLDMDGTPFPVEPAVVEALISVLATVERRFGPVPVTCPVPAGTPQPRVEPDSILVVVSGTEASIEDFQAGTLAAWVDVLRPGETVARRRPQVRLSSENLRVTSTVPAEVTVSAAP